MNNDWISIRYLGFWDVPLNFLVRWDDHLLLFDCPFDEELDDYPDHYTVYDMPELMVKDIEGSWDLLPQKAMSKIGTVSKTDVTFDGTRRKAIRSEVLQRLPLQALTTSTNGKLHDGVASVIPH
jgi:hypothetical protein